MSLFGILAPTASFAMTASDEGLRHENPPASVAAYRRLVEAGGLM
jgi:hypothetical protein